MMGRPFKVGHSEQTIKSWPWWAGYGRLAVQNQEAATMGRMAGWSRTALRSSIHAKLSLLVNGEMYGPVLSQATYRTYEAMEIVRYEKKTMAGGINVDSWGPHGEARQSPGTSGSS